MHFESQDNGCAQQLNSKPTGCVDVIGGPSRPQCWVKETGSMSEDAALGALVLSCRGSTASVSAWGEEGGQ